MRNYFVQSWGSFLAVLTCVLLVGAAFTPSAPALTADSTLTFSMEFSEPLLQPIQLFREDFTRLVVPGALCYAQGVGCPETQAIPLRLLLPAGTEVASVDVVALKTVEMDSAAQKIGLAGRRPIAPHQPPYPIGKKLQRELQIDHAAYSSSNTYPAKLFLDPQVSYCRGYAILNLTVFPTSYIPGQGRLFYYPKMTVTVTLKETGLINRFLRPGNIDDRQWVQSLVANPQVVHTYNKHQISGSREYTGGLCDPGDNDGLGYDYVIITRAALLNTTGTYNWDDLLARKQAEGLEATKVSVEDITNCAEYENPDPLFDDTPARIREFCRDAYEDWGAQYILVGGDQEGTAAIPRRLMTYDYESNCESDLYWSNLDNTFNADGDSSWGEEGDAGFDTASELWIGSIPCDDGTDISNWLTKAFAYADDFEHDYLDNAAFYGGNTGWTCQGDDFIDYSAIMGLDDWLGPIPHDEWDYPEWLGFQYGFETWNEENPGFYEYDLTQKWTAEPPNPTGWMGGSETAAINGLRAAINNDLITLISGIAHANSDMSLDVYSSSWESDYHNTRPFFIHDFGCHCGDMSASSDGVLHSMLFHSDSELAFACVYNTGYGWGAFNSTGSSSATLQKCFWDYLFDTTSHSGGTMNWQMSKAHAWAKDLLAPTLQWPEDTYGTWRSAIQNCLLFGDPAQVIKPPANFDHNVGVQSVDAPSHVSAGTTVDCYTTVVNNGTNDEYNVLVEFLVDDVVLDSTSISTFASQSQEQFSFSQYLADVGIYEIMIRISIPGGVEDYYLDNEKTVSVIAGPDVAVTTIDVPGHASVGMSTLVEGLVENPGTSDEDVTIHLAINGVDQDSQVVFIGSGDSAPVSFDWMPSELGTYPVQIRAELGGAEPYTENNQLSQDVHVFDARGYVLIVDDDDGDSYETYYQDASLAAEYLSDVWDYNSQGTPSAATMGGYDAVIWFMGDDYYETLSSQDRVSLGTYLNGGGRLFITSQDIGYDIGDTAFYSDYLHANYLVDSTGIDTLNGVTGDPISDGLTIVISGGDGADNQYWKDGISAISPAVEIFDYQGSSYGGGLRVDTGTYQLVYLSFGFEAINTGPDRTMVMQRTLDWLLGVETEETLEVSLACAPSSGTVPFTLGIGAGLTNITGDSSRQYWANLAVETPGGFSIANWMSGALTVAAGDTRTVGFTQLIPAHPTVIGVNTFTLSGTDITPAPYNQPPYPPSGDTDMDDCTVTGIAP